MMQNIILGIGTDIISIARIKASIDRRGDALLKRLYTQAEREQAMARKKRRNTLSSNTLCGKRSHLESPMSSKCI